MLPEQSLYSSCIVRDKVHFILSETEKCLWHLWNFLVEDVESFRRLPSKWNSLESLTLQLFHSHSVTLCVMNCPYSAEQIVPFPEMSLCFICLHLRIGSSRWLPSSRQVHHSCPLSKRDDEIARVTSIGLRQTPGRCDQTVSDKPKTRTFPGELTRAK